MEFCKACNQREAKEASKRGYCGECQAAAIDGWHKRMAETNQKREEQRKRIVEIIRQLEATGEEAAFQESNLKHTLSSVIIKPATCDIAQYLRKQGYPIKRIPKGGGMKLLAPANIKVTQSWAWAIAYAKKLTEFGYEAKPDIVDMAGEK